MTFNAEPCGGVFSNSQLGTMMGFMVGSCFFFLQGFCFFYLLGREFATLFYAVSVCMSVFLIFSSSVRLFFLSVCFFGRD